MNILVFILMTITGALIYRWRGSSFSIRPLSQILFCLPLSYLTFYSLVSSEISANVWSASVLFPALIALGVLVLSTLATLTGHGNFMLRGTGGEDETTEFLIKWLKPKIKLYHYRVLGMAMTGLLITLPAGLATSSLALSLSGALKGLAYFLSDKIEDESEPGTVLAEYLTGAFIWGGVACYLI